MTGTEHEALMIGDIAAVGATLAEGIIGLRRRWSVRHIDLPQPTRTSGLAKWFELPRRGYAAHRLTRAAVAVHRPDVVHLHWARFAPFVEPTGCPTVVHAHGSDVRGRSNSLSGRLVRRALDHADLVLVSTPDLLDDVGLRGVYLPNPIDTNLFAPRQGASSGGQRTVLLFAQLSVVKGGPMLVEAARAILACSSEVRVCAIRGGMHDADAAAAGVELIPRLPRHQLARLLNEAHVVVGQLGLGSLGLSELEAMACARPVVTYLKPGLYGHGVPIATAATAEEVTEQCLRLLDEPSEASDMGQRARAYVLTHHDKLVVASRLLDMYERIS